MQNDNRNANSPMPDRLYGEHYPDSFLDVPGPLWSTSIRSLGDYIQHMRKVAEQSYKSYVSGESGQPSKSSESDCDGSQHAKCDTWCASSKCIHGCNRECNCNGNCACIDDEQLPNSVDENRNKDRKQSDYFTDTQGIPVPIFNKKGQFKYRWVGPGAVVGAICEAWNSATERFSGRVNKSVDTERDKT